MTDLAIKPDAEEAGPGDDSTAASDATVELGTDSGSPGSTGVEWAPVEPEPKKRRVGMWIGVGAGVLAAGVVASSLVLIAPGTTVAGVPVGFLTAGAANDAVASRLAETTIVLRGPGGDAEVTAADLGATVDARALADAAFAERPMWNVTQWFAEPLDAPITIDADVATAALRAAAPDLYTDPVDATLTFDAATASYVTTPSVEGTGIDVAAVQDALHDAFVAGDTRVDFDVVSAPVVAETPTFVADSAAANLNDILENAGFYVGSERTVPVARDVVASWLTVEPGDRGTFDITADQAAIQTVVDGLPAAVNVAPVNNTVITNSAGKVLREESAGTAGRELGDTSDIAADYAAQLSTGKAAFELPVTEVAFTTTNLARRVEVNLSSQRAYLFENDKVVKELIMSSGVSSSPTPAGRFTVNGYSRQQSMGCFNGAPYCVENVPYVTWFAPDVGFHGASALRSSLGFPQSHGCVNMWDNDAAFVYDWTATGTEVWVHY